jgi:hypothetical protein
MRKGTALLVALLSMFMFASAVQAANVAIFNDGAYVDTTSTLPPESPPEPENVRADLEAQGHIVTMFTGVDSTSWADAIAANDVVILPELEAGSLSGDLTAGAQTALRNHVAAGGGFIAMFNSNGSLALVSSIFGMTAPVSAGAATSNRNATAILGTVFVDASPALSTPSATTAITTASIPSGARALYTSAANCEAYATTFGTGRIVWLGWDWFGATRPSDWVGLLGLAVDHVTSVPHPAQEVAFFFDPAEVDTTTEGRNLVVATEWLGHNVKLFEGADESAWSTALMNKDAVVIPEVTNDIVTFVESGAKVALERFVGDGGTLIANYNDGNVIAFLNEVFGFSLTGAGTVTGTRQFTTTGSLFQEGPAALPFNNDSVGMVSASLPVGTSNLYSSGATSVLFCVNYGAGRIYWFALDWFNTGLGAVPPFDWGSALGLAFQEQPPRGVFPTMAVAPGGPADLTFTIDDETTATAGNIFWRRGGGNAFNTAALTDNGDGTFSATIPAGDLTSTGVQYYVELIDGLDNKSTQPGGPEAGIFASLPVQVSGFPFASLQPEAFELRGVPVQPANPAPEAAFGLGGYNRSQWRYGVFNPTTGGYAEPDNGAPPANPGQGFWIVARNGTNVTLSGQSSDVSGTITQTLRPGFNQVANPYAFPIDADDVVMGSEVEFNFIAFANGGYVNNNTILLPGTGYWLNNTGGSNVTVRFPALGSGVAAAPAAPDVRMERPSPGELPEGEAGWSVQVASTVGDAFDREQRFGMRAGATDEKDTFDFADAPAPPSGYVAVSLLSPDGNALLTDWRAEDANGATWDVLLRSDRIGENWNLTFDVERELPAGWSLVAIAGAGAEVTDLQATPVLSGEVTSEAFQKSWTVIAGNPDYIGAVRDQLGADVQVFSLSAPRPNPLRGLRSATMDFQVPRATVASVDVFDLQGRRVKTLMNGPVERGQHRVIWDGTNASGQPVAAGVYFVKARAADFSETRKVTYLR